MGRFGSDPERSPGNKKLSKEERVRAGSKKGVAYLPVVDGSKDYHQEGSVDAEGFIKYLDEVSKEHVRRKRGRR